MKISNWYLYAIMVLLAVSLAISQHTIYNQNKTIATYKEVVEVQETTIAIQKNALEYAVKTLENMTTQVEDINKMLGGKP